MSNKSTNKSIQEFKEDLEDLDLELENKFLKEKIIKLKLIIQHQIESCDSCGKRKCETCRYCGENIINEDYQKACEKCGKNDKLYHHSTNDNDSCKELCDTCSKGNCKKEDREDCFICRYYDTDEDELL
jgi:hypothetical protein